MRPTRYAGARKDQVCVRFSPPGRLRKLATDDLDVIAAQLADPHVMRFWPRPFTRDESLEWGLGTSKRAMRSTDMRIG